MPRLAQVKLVKDRFGITSSFADMSPVLIPPGYTKRFLDGAVDEANQYDRIRTAYDRIEAAQPFTVVEGTGHAGVGTIIGCSNADVARALDLEAVRPPAMPQSAADQRVTTPLPRP